MTREQAEKEIRSTFTKAWADGIIKALEQEPRKDEVILTKEEYGKLVSSEFDNGYAQGYRDALDQESVLNKIKSIVAEWRNNTWTDNISNECMIKIAEIIEAESER